MAERSAPAAAVAERLHAQGERLTPQRLMVLEVLQASGEHLTADEIYAHVVARSPYVGRATIYRALAWLKEQGLASVTDLGLGQVQYQYLAERHHHHTVCLGCGGQEEFPDDLVAPLVAALRERDGFQPRLDHLAVFGYCRACRAL
jgi:Fur family transcriptional regulator, ferric uptake regulator